ncbi:hypothetical protein [Nodosilinea sp. E11]|uniref:hypothetical protein n=1 Tax=Nodosilinea sp. E11 TaxID=3037479 RepID=UPI002934B5B6|nr:hypothetical protein [Nodosilinea sp. E11]WOD41099.1 hypothetical protein RRF56_09865 [Nodosilinea sp. E11]
MKRKSKPLITGGLLGLAGLGLLPRGAEAAPELPLAEPEPSLGVALAADPHPVVTPEPSAQTTAPQADEQAAAQPVWTPGVDHVVVDAAAAAAETATPAAATPEPDSTAAIAALPPEETTLDSAASAVSAPELAPNLVVNPMGDGASDQTVIAVVSEPPPIAADLTSLDDELATEVGSPPAAAIAVAADGPGNGSGEGSGAMIAAPAGTMAEAQAPAGTGAETAIADVSEPPSKPVAAKPRPQGLERPAATPEALALSQDPMAQPLGRAVAVAAAPSSAPAIATTPPTRAASPDLATIRARATAVQSLLRDLRSQAGMPVDPAALADQTTLQPSPTRRVPQPKTLARGPQLPQLPGRSVRRAAIADPSRATAANQRSRQQPLPGPQLPDLAGSNPNVALALPTPQPVMSPTLAGISPAMFGAEPEAAPAIAQAAPAAGSAAQIQNDLRIAPLTTAANPPLTFPPSPNAGIPSAFGANWGDLFISASLAGADRVRPVADGSMSMGFGLGDSRQVVGVELAYNLQSVRRFGENGGFDVKVHRVVHSGDDTEVAAAVGLNNFASYGSEAGGSPSSLYGVVTAAHLLQPDHPTNRLPITGTLGLGGGSFSGEGSDVGVIAGVGLQVHPQFSVNTAWSGVGVNVGASIVPVSTIPITLNLLYGDIGNNTRAGSVAVLSIGYGFNFGPRF